MRRYLDPATRRRLMADLAAGMVHARVAEKYGVSNNCVSYHAKKAGILPPRKINQRSGPCEDCGERTWSEIRLCRVCQVARHERKVMDEIGLPKGNWVLDPRARIVRWQEAS